MKQYSVVIVLMTMSYLLISMDEPNTNLSNKFELNLTSGKLPALGTSCVIDFTNVLEAFKVLTKDGALLLKSFIGQEQRGRYCPELCQAEELLHEVIKVNSEETRDLQKALLSEVVSDKKIRNFLSHVAKKSINRLCLMNGLADDDSDLCYQALENNYVVNAYGSFKPYENRMITPLHHILCQAAEGLVDHEYAKYYTEMLLLCRANPNARDDAGNMPMHHASTPELMMLLLQYGGKYDDCGYEDRTPLQNHIRTKNWDVVRCLLKLSVNVNTLDENGDTPLHEAVRQNAPEDIVNLLLYHGASCDVINNESQIPTDMAQDKPNLLSVFESYLQCRLCKTIANDDGNGVIIILELYPWINLVVKGVHILDWANEFYKNNLATKVLDSYLNGTSMVRYEPVEGSLLRLFK